MINDLHSGVKFKTLCDRFLSKIAVYKFIVVPMLPNPEIDRSQLILVWKLLYLWNRNLALVTMMYGHIVVHILSIYNIQALLPGRLCQSLHEFRTWIDSAILLETRKNPIFLGKLQTLPGILKLANGCILFTVYCFISYIILQAETILHRC